VREGHLFVLGDHRSHSRDSRMFGFVRADDVVGVAEYDFWPLRSCDF
jgi:signal peptidase I